MSTEHEMTRAFGALSEKRAPIDEMPITDVDPFAVPPVSSTAPSDMMRLKVDTAILPDPDMTGTISPEQRDKILARLRQAQQQPERPVLPANYADEMPTFTAPHSYGTRVEAGVLPANEDLTLTEDIFGRNTGERSSSHESLDDTSTIVSAPSHEVDLSGLSREQLKHLYRSLQHEQPLDPRSKNALPHKRGRKVLRTLLVSVLAGTYAYGVAEQKDFTPRPAEIVQSLPDSTEKYIDFWYNDGKGPSITEALAIVTNITHKDSEDNKGEEIEHDSDFTRNSRIQ